MLVRSTLWGLLLSSMAVFQAFAAPSIVVSIPPLHSLVQGVTEGVVDAELLFNGQQSPHQSSLAPSTVRKVMTADLVVWVGPALEIPLARALQNVEEGRKMTLLERDDLHILPSRLAGISDVEPDAHSHDAHAVDPHLWLSPENAKAIVMAIRDWLLKNDAANGPSYLQNAERAIRRITDFQDQAKAQLRDSDTRAFITFHDAYQYFERAFSLFSTATITLNPEHKPGARRIKQLRQAIKENDVQCVFSEPQFSATVVNTVIEGSAVKAATLDPLGISLEPGPDLWFDMMQQLVTQFSSCLKP